MRVAMLTRLEHICNMPDKSISDAGRIVRDHILPCAELTAYVLATTFGIYLCPELMCMKSLIGCVTSIAKFNAAFRDPNGELTGGELLAGYLCHPAADHVSANSQAALVYGVKDAMASYDPRWDELDLAAKYRPTENTEMYRNMQSEDD